MTATTIDLTEKAFLGLNTGEVILLVIFSILWTAFLLWLVSQGHGR